MRCITLLLRSVWLCNWFTCQTIMVMLHESKPCSCMNTLLWYDAVSVLHCSSGPGYPSLLDCGTHICIQHILNTLPFSCCINLRNCGNVSVSRTHLLFVVFKCIFCYAFIIYIYRDGWGVSVIMDDGCITCVMFRHLYLFCYSSC